MKNLVRTFLAAASVVVLVACGTNAEPYAAKVNGNRVETKDLDRELNAIASNKEYLRSLEEASVPVQGEGKGTFDAAFVARVLTRRIYLELVRPQPNLELVAPVIEDGLGAGGEGEKRNLASGLCPERAGGQTVKRFVDTICPLPRRRVGPALWLAPRRQAVGPDNDLKPLK